MDETHFIIIRNCEGCGTEFEVGYRFREKSFCSNECFKNRPKRCGKEFPVKSYEKITRIYCSEKCFRHNAETKDDPETKNEFENRG